MKQACIVTDKYFHPLFYQDETNIIIDTSRPILDNIINYYFCYDIAIEHNVELIQKPWEEDVLPAIFSYWKNEKEKIKQQIQLRQREKADEPMKTMLSLFISGLYWLNQRHVPPLATLLEEANKLQYKPINISERLEFILQHHTHTHSYIQLDQLFLELEKLYAKSNITRRR